MELAISRNTPTSKRCAQIDKPPASIMSHITVAVATVAAMRFTESNLLNMVRTENK
jgi:hypothetical protein